VRDVLALIVCGNRICEVITATLGPLPLDQLPKSKPVTPYAVFPDDTHSPAVGKESLASATSANITTRARPPAFPGQQEARWPDTEARRPSGNLIDRLKFLFDLLNPLSGPLSCGHEKPLRALAVAEDAPAGV
jgi:hypothetical protein